MKKLVVLLTAVAFVVGMALPAMAADWNFYGSARVFTYYAWTDETKDDKFDELHFGLQGNSRIGARVKASDSVSGQFEFSVSGNNQPFSSGNNVGTRIILGHWNFGAGTLSVGQGYTPVDQFYSSRAGYSDEGLLSFGEPYTNRQPMLQLAIAGFKFAFVRVHGPEVIGLNAADRLTKLPKMELSYGQSFGLVSFDVVGGYQWYENEVGDRTYDINSWMLGAGVWVKPGPARIGGIGYYSRNARQFGQYYGGGFQSGQFGAAQLVAGEVKDNNTWALAGIVGFKATNMLDFEVGAGYIQSELDVDNATTEKWLSAYAQTTITLAPGVFIVPNYGYLENLTDGFDFKEHILGAKWQINF